MSTTQFDIVQKQAEAAVRNAASGTISRLRRETSLVARASQWLGRAVRQGEESWKKREKAPRRKKRQESVVRTEPAQMPPAPDGYVRRSPVQPVYRAANYRRRQVRLVAGVVILVILIFAALSLFRQLGVFGW